MMSVLKVLIVDDSAVMRQVLSARLNSCPDIEVIAVAADPLFAIEKMKKVWPDVIVLDVEMPRMDGITFLKKIMAERPTPVVICSTLTEAGAETTIQALSAGAVGAVAKPKAGLKDYLQDASEDLVNMVRAAGAAQLSSVPAVSRPPVAAANKKMASAVNTGTRLIAIGTSTGGTRALEAVLSVLPETAPGIVVVQHMPEKFTAAFASRLNSICQVEVKEAQTGDQVVSGRVLIAPGGRHMQLKRRGEDYYVEIIDGPPVNRHRPSVDVLFRSVAQTAGKHALGVIMTGMGDDGARGLREMHEAGAYTIAQDEESCVVFGMPKAAIKLGAVADIMPLESIPQAIVSLVPAAIKQQVERA